MAKLHVERKVTYSLELTQTEAMWLRDYLQNGPDNKVEDVVDAEKRKTIFLALHKERI